MGRRCLGHLWLLEQKYHSSSRSFHTVLGARSPRTIGAVRSDIGEVPRPASYAGVGPCVLTRQPEKQLFSKGHSSQSQRPRPQPLLTSENTATWGLGSNIRVWGDTIFSPQLSQTLGDHPSGELRQQSGPRGPALVGRVSKSAGSPTPGSSPPAVTLCPPLSSWCSSTSHSLPGSCCCGPGAWGLGPQWDRSARAAFPLISFRKYLPTARWGLRPSDTRPHKPPREATGLTECHHKAPRHPLSSPR